MDVRLFAVFLLFNVTLAAEGNVQFWMDTVTLTCPREGTWYIDEKPKGTNTTYTFIYDANTKPLSYCQYDDPEATTTPAPTITYYFYVKGKVCKTCFELDASLFMVIIIVDVIGTVILMAAIYRCTKKKGSTGPTQAKPPSRSGQAPPTPSRDYEQLNVHTRSQDTYSIVNRTG